MAALGAKRTYASAVKGRCRFLRWLSRKECSYASFKACAMSAIRSDGCSMPIDSRIVESRTPIFWRMSAGTPEWVMLAGRQAGKRLSAAQAHRQLEDLQRVQEFEGGGDDD